MSYIVGERWCAYCYVIVFIDMHLCVISLHEAPRQHIPAETALYQNLFSMIRIPPSEENFYYIVRENIPSYENNLCVSNESL